MVRCPHCRSEVSEWAALCPGCGADLGAAEPVEAVSHPPFLVPTVAVEHGAPPEPGARLEPVAVAEPSDAVGTDTAVDGGPPQDRQARLRAAAAATVVVVIAAVVLVVLGRHAHPAAAHRPPAPPGAATTVAPPITVPVQVPATTLPSETGNGPATSVLPSGANATHLIDLTWISDARGFALVSVNCLALGSCAEILTTSDGGQTWAPGPNLPDASASVASQPCIASCFQHLRFASGTVGYLWGQAGLYLTVDGGGSWVDQPTSQIAALEAVPGWAVRVVSPGGTPGPREVDRAPIGSGLWAPVPAVVGHFGAAIFTAGRDLYIAWGGHTSGGGTDAHTAFVRSLDGGTTWASFGDPCGQTSDGSELDATVFAAAPNGNVAVLCAPRLATGTLWYTESLDAGAHFGALEPVPVSAEATVQLALADNGAVALVASTAASQPSQVIRSSDGGRGWQDVLSAPTPATPPVEPWLGFEDAVTGRVSFGDTALWTTSDAGVTWTAEQVPLSR